jgi:UDP-glucose:glycoprotein glucosyltransferase
MREERRRMLSLTSLGLTPEQAFTLLTDDDIITAMTEPDPMEGLVDASDKIESGGVITWWNNIEKDKRFVVVCITARYHVY